MTVRVLIFILFCMVVGEPTLRTFRTKVEPFLGARVRYRHGDPQQFLMNQTA